MDINTSQKMLGYPHNVITWIVIVIINGILFRGEDGDKSWYAELYFKKEKKNTSTLLHSCPYQTLQTLPVDREKVI